MSDKLMEMVATECRDAFEVWAKGRYLNTFTYKDSWTQQTKYAGSHIQIMWEGWQAAWNHSGAKPREVSVFNGEDEGSPTERVAWRIVQASHSNLPADQRPMSWSDMSPEQQTRIRKTAEDAIEETLLLYDRLKPPLKENVTQRIWLEAALAGVLRIAGYRRGDKEYFFFQDDIWRIRKEMKKAVEGSEPKRESVEEGVPYLHNYADAVHGHYSIAMIKDGITWFWNKGGWAAFGEVFDLTKKPKS